LEEFRDLSVLEWNFKSILKDKYSSLLSQQQIYWKKRGTVKWVKFGDEGTKFFHANATIKQRRNLITALKDSSGLCHTNHNSKANILWEAFKERLGSSDSPEMSFHLEQLLQRANIWSGSQTPSPMRKLM
jgi:hypothetical protein